MASSASGLNLTALLDNLPGVVYRCKNDEHWTMEFLSSGCYALTGYQPEELIGNQEITFAELIHQDDQQVVWESVQEALQERESFQITYRIKTASGHEKWVWEQGSGIFSDQGELEAIEGFISDITEFKETEALLRESESFNQVVLHSLNEHIVVLNSQGQIIKTNKAWDKFAYQNTPWRDRNYQGENYLAVCQKAVQEGDQTAEKAFLGITAVIKNILTGFSLEYPCHSSTDKHWFLMQVTPLSDETGGVVIAHTDITELKQSQRKVQEQRHFLRQVIDTNPSLVFAKDYDGRFTLVNEAVARIYGTTNEDLLGKTDADFNANHDQIKRFLKADRQVISTNRPKFIPAEQVTSSNGETYWFQTIKVPFQSSDGGRQVLGVSTDITERKKIESQLEASRNELRIAYDKTLLGWVKALDLRDKETQGHTQRVTEMTVHLAQAIGVDADELEHLRRGALLHDIGKMAIPDSILLKPDRLTNEEWEVMRMHPVYAYEWLKNIDYLKPADRGPILGPSVELV